MVCLESPASPQPDDHRIKTAPQGLQRNLGALQPAQRRELLIAVLQLCEAPHLCREIQAVLERGALGPATDASALGLVSGLEPALGLKLPGLQSHERSRGYSWPARGIQEPPRELQQDIALIGLSIRMENSLRRNGFHRLSDLIGLGEEQVLALRGVGHQGLEELRAGLERLGLTFPLAPDRTEPFIPPAPLTQPQPTRIDTEEDQHWLERASALIGGATAEVSGAMRMLEELISLTLEHFSGLEQRIGELQQLRSAFQDIQAIGEGDPTLRLMAEGLQGALLQAYHLRFQAVGQTRSWLRDLRRTLESARGVAFFLRHAAGATLQAIGAEATPPISGQAVRQSFRRLSECIGLTPRELAAQLADRREQQERQRLRDALQPWLLALGRLPFHTDPLEQIEFATEPAAAAVLAQVLPLNLHQRLELYASLAIEVGEAEWALHLRVIGNAEQEAGIGYWHRLDALREFLHRYAVLLGAPGLMPKQLQLPSAVSGAVQRLGGQSAVAAKVGLTYQGQLVGESGRTYWSEQRLRELLEQTATHCGLAAAAMPSRMQITTFLSSGVVPEYLDKQPNTVFAALSRQGRLRWPQVAERFGRVV